MRPSPLNLKTAKYGKDAEFSDPVVRCDSCRKLILTRELKEHGMCVCGNRRVRNVMTFTPEEREKMTEWDVDPDFLALFEEVSRG